MASSLFHPRLKHFLNYVAGPLLFAAVSYSIYAQLKDRQDMARQWQLVVEGWDKKALGFMATGLLLVPVNWGLEALKWKWLVNRLMPMRFLSALMSVLAGISFTMLTPNRLGEFLGRMLYMPDGTRLKTAALSAMGSISQLAITLLGGILGLALLLKTEAGQQQLPSMLAYTVVYGTLVVLIVLLVFFFQTGRLVRLLEKWPAAQPLVPYVHALGVIGNSRLWTILGISMIRYIIFLLQYRFVFLAFRIDMPFIHMLAATSAMFLMLAVVPTIALAELSLRGKAGLLLFGLFHTNAVGILAASGAVWLMNIIVPSLAGSLILAGVKIYGKKDYLHT